MADVRIIDLTVGAIANSHYFESDDGNASYRISATDLKSYCQTGLTPQSIGIAAGVTTTELNYLDGVTSGIQGQIDAKVSTSITIDTASGLTGGGSLVSSRTISLDVPSLTNKATPSSSDQVLIYDPVSSSHKRTTVSGITSGLSGGASVTAHSALTGLNADDHPQYSLANGTRWTANQSANRVAISTASGHLSVSSITTTQLEYLSDVTSVIQAQINAKAPINNPIFTGTVSGITKAMIGLSNVDNTSDASKPISTLQQAGLDLKAPNSRVIATASGLTGGGDLSTDRTIALNISALQAKVTPASADQVLIYDISASSHRVITVSGITSGISKSTIGLGLLNNILISYGTANPSGGTDGDLYFQYT